MMLRIVDYMVRQGPFSWPKFDDPREQHEPATF